MNKIHSTHHVSIKSKYIQKFGFINGVDNVNWPPYRDYRTVQRLPYSYSTEITVQLLPQQLTFVETLVRFPTV